MGLRVLVLKECRGRHFMKSRVLATLIFVIAQFAIGLPGTSTAVAQDTVASVSSEKDENVAQ